MTDVLDWESAANSRTVVQRACQALARGELVAFPTETVYGLAASALVPAAVERLRHAKGRAEEKPLTLAIRGAAEVGDWVPGLSRLGRRLARRCWPGPVTLVSGAGVPQGLASRLPDAVRQRVCPAGTVGLRVPAHEAIHEVLRLLPGPLVLTSANPSGAADATTAEQVLQSVGDRLALIINDGPSQYGQASTVVRINGTGWEVLREGVVTAADLQRLSACMILFVCTGNTCRSPLAEVLCQQLLAHRLGCPPEELPRRGFIVLSAGLAAMMAGEAAPEAVAVAREFGADLGGHSSRPLRPDLVAQADYLVAMTHSHLRTLDAHFGQLGPQPQLLGRDGSDIADPIGCDQQVYRECAQQIRRHLEGFVSELEQP
jgi:protein-tyrosine phosphatase